VGVVEGGKASCKTAGSERSGAHLRGRIGSAYQETNGGIKLTETGYRGGQDCFKEITFINIPGSSVKEGRAKGDEKG